MDSKREDDKVESYSQNKSEEEDKENIDIFNNKLHTSTQDIDCTNDGNIDERALQEIDQDNNNQNQLQVNKFFEGSKSLSQKHNQIRVQLQEFREKYITTILNDELSTQTEASVKKFKRENVENDSFENLNGYQTLNIPNNCKNNISYLGTIEIQKSMILPTQEDSNVENMNKSYCQTSSLNKYYKSWDTRNCQKEKPSEERIKIHYL